MIRVSYAVDRVSDAVDSDLDKADTNSIKLTYDNASDTNRDSTKYDQNTKGASKDTDTKDKVQNDRYDNTVTQVKWSTETNEIDNQYLRDYDNMRRQMEDKQNDEYYKAQRQIHNAIMGDTPVKTVHNRHYIDNTSAYDSELQKISKSVCLKLDLDPNSLPGAQQYATVEAAATMQAQDKTMKVQDKENALKTYRLKDNGQYKREIYKRAEYSIQTIDCISFVNLSFKAKGTLLAAFLTGFASGFISILTGSHLKWPIPENKCLYLGLVTIQSLVKTDGIRPPPFSLLFVVCADWCSPIDLALES